MIKKRYDGEQPMSFGLNKVRFGAMILSSVMIIAVGFGLWYWFVWRIEVPAGHFARIIKKVGNDIENKMVIAPSSDYKGPQVEILKEGRHFLNPILWDVKKPEKATVVPEQYVGIRVRLFGEPLDEGEYIAWESRQKGILAEPLNPGRHYINTYEYQVKQYPMIKIEPGQMGVVTLLSGKEPVDPFAFVMNKDEKGVQPFLLPPGTHPEYSNPYLHYVTPIDVRSHKFEFFVLFPSKMGFDVRVEGTIEWAPQLLKLPELFVKYVDEADLERSGGIDNIVNKVILPAARGYFRIVGGKYRAVSFMKGDTRAKVQKDVENQLIHFCSSEGIEIKSVVIKDARPPQEICDQYARREMAIREIDKYREQIKMQIGEIVMEGGHAKVDSAGNDVLDEYGRQIMEGGTPVLDEFGEQVRSGGRIAQIIEQRKKDRATRLGEIRKEVAALVREAEEYERVEVTKAEQQKAVALIQLQAAQDRASAVRAKGLAEADVIIMEKEAQAEGVRAQVNAFGSGEMFAEYQLIQKIAPGIESIWSNTKDSFASDMFERFITISESQKEGDK